MVAVVVGVRCATLWGQEAAIADSCPFLQHLVSSVVVVVVVVLVVVVVVVGVGVVVAVVL